MKIKKSPLRCLLSAVALLLTVCVPRQLSAAKAQLHSLQILGDYESVVADLEFSNLEGVEVADDALGLGQQIEVYIGGETKPVLPKSKLADVLATSSSKWMKDFIWELTTLPERVEEEDKFRVRYQLSLQKNIARQDSLKQLAEPNGTLKFKTVFYPRDKGNPTPVEGYAVKVYAKPAESPPDFRVLPAHKGLTLTWKVQDKIAAFPDTKLKLAANKVLLMIFHPGEAHNLGLDAYRVDLAAKKDEFTAAACEYVGGVACVQCPQDDQGYFIASEQEVKGVTFLQVENTGSYTVQGLQPGQTYTAVLQYAEGISRSPCVEGVSIQTLSLTEERGGEEGRVADPRCFIATAAYGSSLDKHVQALRWFRDYILLPAPGGPTLVAFYYRYSPALAEKISGSETLKRFSRTLLYLPAWVAAGLRELFTPGPEGKADR